MFSSRTSNRRRRAVDAANQAARARREAVVERVQEYTEPDNGGQARAAVEQANVSPSEQHKPPHGGYPGAPWGVR